MYAGADPLAEAGGTEETLGRELVVIFEKRGGVGHQLEGWDVE